MVESTKDFEELLECFKCHEVKFVIVGAHALAHHAKPRYTKDLDIFVEATSANGFVASESAKLAEPLSKRRSHSIDPAPIAIRLNLANAIRSLAV